MTEELIEEIDWEGNVIAIHPKSKLKEQMFPHKVSVIIPKGKNGKFILSRRAEDKHPFPGTWCCSVGGKSIAGEDEEKAAIREMQEEIGKVYPVEKVTSIVYDKEDYKGLFTIFTTQSAIMHEEFNLDLSEIQYSRDFYLSEIIDMIEKNPEEFAPTFREILKEFAKYCD